MEDLSKLRFLMHFADAARSGNVERVSWFVRVEGVDPNAPIPHGMEENTTALHVATANNDMALAQYLVEEAHCDVERKNQHGRTALHMACKSNLLSMIRYLVETGGANLEARDLFGLTPLHCASYMGRVDILEYLVEKRQADVDAKDKEGRTSLDHAIIFHYMHVNEDIIRFLLPRTSSIAKRALVYIWKEKRPPAKKKELHRDNLRVVLDKYALGHGLASDFKRFPIHTLISHFPLPSTKAFQDCITLFPTSALSLLDAQGRLPIHVALLLSTNNDHLVNRYAAPSIVSFLFDREPRSALSRDPVTGLYPHETVAGLVSRDDEGWLDVVFKMFRLNPEQVLRSQHRGSLVCCNGRKNDDHSVS